MTTLTLWSPRKSSANSGFSVRLQVMPAMAGIGAAAGPVLNMRGEVVGVARAKLNEIEMRKNQVTTGGHSRVRNRRDDALRLSSAFQVDAIQRRVGGDMTIEAVTKLARQFTVQVGCAH